MNRNVWAAIVATIAVAAVVILGFRELGSPGTQRLKQADRRRVQALAQLAQEVSNTWRVADKSLPDDLEKLSGANKKDPLSGMPFAYHKKSSSGYELCATFATDDRDTAQTGNADNSWFHPKGDYCFQLDASRPVPSAPYY
jgi:hypothetical protein